MEEDAIRELVKRLGRPHPSGGTVIERAAILSQGADFNAVVEWIVAHDGRAEAAAPAAAPSGLYGSRLSNSAGAEPRNALRFVLPAGALA
jgi:hypothetical protein